MPNSEGNIQITLPLTFVMVAAFTLWPQSAGVPPNISQGGGICNVTTEGKSPLTQQQAKDLIEKWFSAKSQVFAEPYDLDKVKQPA